MTDSVRRILAFTFAALTGATLGLAFLVVNPATAVTPSGDAIFVHAGGNGERLRTAVALFEEGVAKVIVVSNPGGRSSQVPPGLCGSTETVICVVPPTVDTAGEARALGDLMAERGWDRVVVVTSDYHVSRAGMLDRSCTDATIEAVAAPARRRQPLVTPARIQETLALPYSWLFQTCG
ncbi:MAG: YdcF family protein [Acidimicrobiia bacterium]